MEDVPSTHRPSQGTVATDKDSQESIDRVPESPPIYTQETNSQCGGEGTGDDVEAQISTRYIPSQDDNTNDTAAVVFNNGTVSHSSTESERIRRKDSDVVIDMECVEMEESNGIVSGEVLVLANDPDFLEEFPDEDDSLLVSAVENAEDPGSVEPGVSRADLEFELTSNANFPQRVEELSEQLKVDDGKRKKVIEGFRKYKPLDKIFPDVRCSEHNTIGFMVKPNYVPGDPLEPNPPKCLYKWEPKYIPMPFCNENIMFVKPRIHPPARPTEDKTQETSAVESSTTEATTEEEKVFGPPRKIRIWERITDTLSTEPILCSEDFLSTCKRYCRINSEFKALDYCLGQLMSQSERTHFFDNVVPFMTSLVLKTEEIVTCPVPVLKKNLNHNISLSQKQVGCLLANAFFSTFPRRFKTQVDMPSINFKELFAEGDERILIVKAQKIRCLIHYFTRIHAKMPNGVVTYTRKNLRHSNMPDWANLDKSMTKLVPLLQGTIEDDGAGMLKVDFANCNIGGGVLGRGAVQEEILFVIYPELLLTRLFTEKLNYNEAVIITGCERFSRYEGYSLNFKFAGDYQDVTPLDSKGRRCTQIVAIDALYISRPTFQYHPKHILRELNKAYVGFSSPISAPVAVATGKWGCGAFNGDPQLKTIIQWLAASHAGRDVAIFTFEDVACLNDILSICDALQDMKIKEVWHLLNQYHKLCCAGGKVSRSLKEFCGQYSDGMSWAKEIDSKPPSLPKKTKEVPITQFYSATKRQTAVPDDANVTAITNGMNKINSPAKSLLPPGKRLREDEEGLTEQEIRQQLLSTDDALEVPEEKPVELCKEGEASTGENSTSPSPTSSKRPKRLLDFYSTEKTDTG